MPQATKVMPQRKGVRNPMVGARSLSPGGRDKSVVRRIPTKHGTISLRVYEIIPNRLMVNCKTVEVDNGKVKEKVRKGAVLVYDHTLKMMKIINDGLPAATRAYGAHVGRGYDAEQKELDRLIQSLPGSIRMLHDLLPGPSAADARYAHRMHSDAHALAGARTTLKVEAHEKLAAAAKLTDSLGRRNVGKSVAQTWASLNRLRDRSETIKGIRYRTDSNVVVLALVHERIRSMLADLQGEVQRGIDLLHTPPAAKYWPSLKGLCLRLKNQADRFEKVAIRPYGTNAFPHIVSDLREAAVAIGQDQFFIAIVMLDRIRRSIILLDVYNKLEEALTVVSLFKAPRRPITMSERGSYLKALKGFKTYLEENRTLDKGFRNPIIKDAARHLGDAIAAADSKVFDVKASYQALQRCCRCF